MSEETYRKLYDHPPPEFERLPFLARSVAARLLIHCDWKGRIIPVRDPKTRAPMDGSSIVQWLRDGRDASDAQAQLFASLVTDLAFHVRAHRTEETALGDALAELLLDGYLVLDAGFLEIRNFVKRQRSDSALRMEKKRKKDRPPGDGGDAQASPLVSSGLVSSSAPRSEPVQPETAREVLCPPDLDLTDEQRGMLEMNVGAPAWALKAMRDALVLKWADGVTRRTKAQWVRQLAVAIQSDWSDPAKRPKRPAAPSPEVVATRQARDRMDAKEAERQAALEASGGAPPPGEQRRAVSGLAKGLG